MSDLEVEERLSSVDWKAVGLGDLGGPEGFHERGRPADEID